MDGVYTMDSVYFSPGVTVQATEGARPIIVHSDGYPPAVTRGAGANVSGIWFGGLRIPSNVGARVISNGAGGGFTDCTFFNSLGIINGSDAHGNIFRRNRFVSCGYGLLDHPIYIANSNSSQESHGVLTEECTFVSCKGFSVHYYHEPSYGLAQYNFIGDAQEALAIQGDLVGPSANRNIIWDASGAPLYHSAPGTCDHNVWHGCSQPNPGALAGAKTFDNNYFHGVTTNGSNPVTWNDSDVETNFGKTPAQIDAAISALETAFAGTVAEIHDSATIETHFATIKSVIDTWKLQ
jgi:hypothetical protein